MRNLESSDKQELAPNEVLIHIWDVQRDSPTGHVALQTSEIYASLWPETPNLIKGVPPKEKRTFNDDLIDEKRPPEHSIKLSLLDVKTINEKYRLFEKQKCNWKINSHINLKDELFMSKVDFDKSIENMELKDLNCSCLVYILLMHGGIDQLVEERLVLATRMNVGYITLSLMAGLITGNPAVAILTFTSLNNAASLYDRSRTFFRPQGILRIVKKAEQIETDFKNGKIKSPGQLRVAPRPEQKPAPQACQENQAKQNLQPKASEVTDNWIFTPMIKHTFIHRVVNANFVHLAGSFNNWLKAKNGKVEVEKANDKYRLQQYEPGVWKLTVALPPGNHEFKYVVNGGERWENDNNTQYSQSNDQRKNSLLHLTEVFSSESQHEPTFLPQL